MNHYHLKSYQDTKLLWKNVRNWNYSGISIPSKNCNERFWHRRLIAAIWVRGWSRIKFSCRIRCFKKYGRLQQKINSRSLITRNRSILKNVNDDEEEDTWLIVNINIIITITKLSLFLKLWCTCERKSERLKRENGIISVMINLIIVTL